MVALNSEVCDLSLITLENKVLMGDVTLSFR